MMHHPLEVPLSFFWPKEMPMIKSHFSIPKVRWEFFLYSPTDVFLAVYLLQSTSILFIYFFRIYFSTAFKVEIIAIMCNKRFFNIFSIVFLCCITKRECLQKSLKILTEQIQVTSFFPRCLKWIWRYPL